MNILLIGGRFDDNTGRSSGVVARIRLELLGYGEVTAMNGGTWSALQQALTLVPAADLVIWMPDVDNSHEKLLGRIKEINPRCMLVTSKNNLDGKYTCHDLIARALAAKANLLIEFTRSDSGYALTIVDPLGNRFLDRETNLARATAVLAGRVAELAAFSRVGSRRIGEAIAAPELPRFFDLVRRRAETFHELIHAANSTRFLGNASFRCENGFPSYRAGGLVFVSRRNVDKRLLGAEAFVAVSPENLATVEYFGDNKPSVDTPVQLLLYNRYRRVGLMLHSHAYIEGAPFTDRIIPCGAIEEVEEIGRLFPDADACNFSVNLKGHGSLALAADVSYLESVTYYGRPLPEAAESDQENKK